MTLLSERLQTAMDEAGMRPTNLAKCVGVSRATVSAWLRCRHGASGKNLVRAARCLNVRAAWLVEGKLPKEIDPAEGMGNVSLDQRIRHIPIVSFVEAGGFTETTDPYPIGYADDYAVIDSAVYPVGPRAFALRIRGDSMREEYLSGEIIVIDPDVEPNLREPVVAKRDEDDEATFKLYCPRGHDDEGYPIIELEPINPHFPTLVINREHPGRIIGPMVTRIQGRRRH